MFNSIRKQTFIAKDGTIFLTQSDLNAYQVLLEKTKPLFFFDEDEIEPSLILGLDKAFLIKFRREGFNDLKTIVKYSTQIKILSDLINT